jgi:hypothetical protein
MTKSILIEIESYIEQKKTAETFYYFTVITNFMNDKTSPIIYEL